MKIIITGNSGFVGKNLSSYLTERNHEVVGLSLRKDDWETFFERPSDVIIHLAGKAHDLSNVTNEKEYFHVNFDLTKKVFDLFLKSSARDFFFFSSVKAAADSLDSVLTEEILENPKTAYGKSKLAAEKYLLSFDLPTSKRVFVIRPCMIHGPGNKGNLNLLYNVVNKGIPWPLGSFDNQRSFLNIGNLCYLVQMMIMDKSLKSGKYNFADDKSLSTNELVKIMSKTIGNKGRIFHINKSVIELISKLGDKIALPLNTERLKKLTESYLVSNQKIKDNLGIVKLPISVEEGISITIRSFNKK